MYTSTKDDDRVSIFTPDKDDCANIFFKTCLCVRIPAGRIVTAALNSTHLMPRVSTIFQNDILLVKDLLAFQRYFILHLQIDL